MEINEYKTLIAKSSFDDTFIKLYNADSETLTFQKNRYLKTIDAFGEKFGQNRDISIYSAPGRTEICGNHTDHNNGLVIAAAVNVDTICVVSKNKTNIINAVSKNFGDIKPVDLSCLKPQSDEKETTQGLIRGVCAGIIENGGRCEGFDIYINSNVLQGSGLSSSAAFEVAIATAINHEFCNGEISKVKIAQIGQLAENNYFGKPSGLMDQLSSSVGGVVAIDFKDNENPTFTSINFNLEEFNLALVIVDSKASHADLTEDYASIKNEMCSIAQIFWKKSLREIDYETFINHISYLRQQLGDRAILRGLHFYMECDRVLEIQKAIKDKNIDLFLSKIIESGHSSFEYNQNAYQNSEIKKQPVSVALAAAQSFLQDKRGAWRLQGGGFAGTIQCFVDKNDIQKFAQVIDASVAQDCCHILSLRNYGAIKIEQQI